MAQLTLIARWKAKQGAEGRLNDALRVLVAPTRAEDGCINYDLHRSIEDRGLFMFYENWTSKEQGETAHELATYPGLSGETGRSG